MLGKKSKLYRTWCLEWERYKCKPMGLELANLGSTCDANNFDYTYWNKRGFNFASAPQDMYYDSQLLEQYGDCLKKGAIVFISLSEFTFLVDKYGVDFRNYKYYGYVEPERIPNYSIRKARMIKYCPGLLCRECFKQELKEYLKKILRYDSWKKTTRVSLEDSSKQMMSNWMHEFGWENGALITVEQKATMERSWNIFMKNIGYCHENDLIPVVVIPPFNAHLKKLMPVDILDDCLWNHIRAIKKLGIRVISFWDDSELEAEIYYQTPICLNEAGKEIFNHKLQVLIFGGKE